MLNVSQALRDGVRTLKDYPIIFVPFILVGILNYWLLSRLADIVTIIIHEWPFLVSLFTQKPSPSEENFLTILTEHFGENFLLSFNTFEYVAYGISFAVWVCLFLGIVLIFQAYQRNLHIKTAALHFIKNIFPVYVSFAMSQALVGLAAGAATLIAVLLSVLVYALTGMLPPVLRGAIIVFLSLGALLGAIVFVSIKLMYFMQAVIFNGHGMMDCLKVSWRITKGAWWKNAYLFSLFSILNLLAFLVLAGGFVAGFMQIALVVYGLCTAIIAAIAASTFCFAYIQLRESTAKGGDTI